MKRAAIIIAASITILAGIAVAGGGTVRHEQIVVTIGATGSATYTNNTGYSHLTITALHGLYNLDATNQITAKRVTATGSYTQTVGTVTCAAGNGSQTTLAVPTLLMADKLQITSLIATNGTLLIEADRYDWR